MQSTGRDSENDIDDEILMKSKNSLGWILLDDMYKISLEKWREDVSVFVYFDIYI